MSELAEIQGAILRAPFACGWRDLDGITRISWGEDPKSHNGLTLHFRGFDDRPFTSALWRNFPANGVCGPENFRELTAIGHATHPGLSLGEGECDPSREAWRILCGKIDEHLREGRMSKVVPARTRRHALTPSTEQSLHNQLLPRLFAAPLDGTYRFFFRWRDAWFLGATPELLFRREGEELLVPAIAGTRSRPEDPGALDAVRAELLANKKENLEHSLVVEGIKASLQRLGLEPHAPPRPEILPLRKLLHLYTPVRARHRDLPAEKLIAALHPTAAVGGEPRRLSQEFLAEHEPWERGLFASPLHFRWRGGEICLVAIRSALVQPGVLHFFAGAGYVAGADWAAEWAETEQKMDSTKLLLEEARNQ